MATSASIATLDVAIVERSQRVLAVGARPGSTRYSRPRPDASTSATRTPSAGAELSSVVTHPHITGRRHQIFLHMCSVLGMSPLSVRGCCGDSSTVMPGRDREGRLDSHRGTRAISRSSACSSDISTPAAMQAS